MKELHGPSIRSWQRHLGCDEPLGDDAAVALRRALASGTIAQAAEETLAARATDIVLEVDDRPVTGAELLSESAAVAGALESSGTAPGSRVLIALPSSVGFVACYLGVLRAGCSAVLANPALTKDELEHLLPVGRPAAGLVSEEVGGVLAGVASRVAPRTGTDESVLVTFADTVPPAKNEVPGTAGPSPGDEAVLAWTSGSTGAPKGVPLTHANVLASIRSIMAAWRWTADDVVVHCLPLFHQHGLGAVHALALGGGKTVLRSRFDPEELASTVHRERASVLLAVPAIYQRLSDEGCRVDDFSSLRLAVSGSAPLSPTLFEAAAAAIGKEPLERYGLTESGLDVSNLYDGPRKAGAVGYALPGVEVLVADPDGREVDPGTDGEIRFRGPQVFAGYLAPGADQLSDDRPSDQQPFDESGWFRSGDIGRVDPDDGALSITGRAKEVIISGGMNVYPREVEVVIERHPAVAAVAVGAVPSDRWGEAVYAFVVPRRGASLHDDELTELCRRSLAPYKRPKQFVVVDDLPRNHMGKVVRSALAPLVTGVGTEGVGTEGVGTEGVGAEGVGTEG